MAPLSKPFNFAKGFTILSIVFGLMMASPVLARNVFLNGIDISSARHQLLENVTVRIDGDGNLLIEAPHYQVNEENTYIPLSRWRSEASAPVHQKPGALPEPASTVGQAAESKGAGTVRDIPAPLLQGSPTTASAQGEKPALQEKPGDKIPTK